MIKRIIQNKVFQNFSFLTIGGVLSQLLGVIALMKIARILTPADYGNYSFLLSQGQLIMAIGDLGIANIIIRNIARDNTQTKSLIATGIRLKFIAVAFISGIYILYNSVWGNLTHQHLLLLILFALFNCSGNLFQSIIIGYQKMLLSSIVNLTWSLFWVAFVFILPSSKMSVYFIFSLFAALILLKGGAFYLILRVKGLIKGVITSSFKSRSIKLLSESWPYLSLIILMVPVNYLSNNFLDINSTNTEIGYFNIANRLVRPILLVISFALSALFPNLSILWTKDPTKFKANIKQGIKYLILTALILSFIFTLFAKELVIFLFTDKYIAAVKVCQLQIWYIFLMGINSTVGTIWGAMDKEKLIFKTAIVNTLIATPLLYLGSKYGAIGISFAYVISFAIFEIYLWYTFKKSIKVNFKGDFIIWGTVVIVFLLSYFLFTQYSFLLRIVISIVAIFIYLLYSRNGYLKMKAIQ